MKTSNLLISVSLYLRGDKLDPNIVSAKLGINPSSSQYKGEKRFTPTHREYVTKIGVWELDVNSDSFKLYDHLDQLASMINVDGDTIRGIVGVQEAYIDVFIALDADVDGGGTIEFEISKENISALDRLNLPVRYTITTVNKNKASTLEDSSRLSGRALGPT